MKRRDVAAEMLERFAREIVEHWENQARLTSHRLPTNAQVELNKIPPLSERYASALDDYGQGEYLKCIETLTETTA